MREMENGGTRRGLTPRRVFRSAAIALICLALLADCTSGSPRHHHPDRKGPLSANSGHGATMFEPFARIQYVTFGGNLLCVREEVGEVILEKVTAHASVKPLKIAFWLRAVGRNEVKGQKHTAGSTEVFANTHGRPPAFTQREPYAGVYTDHVAGTKITTSCKKDRSRVGFTDLLVVMKVSKAGAYVTGLTINYRFQGDEYALDTNWRLGACGTALPRGIDDGICEPSD